MTKVEITKGMIGLLGYNRSSKKIEDATTSATKAARELKAVAVDSDGKYILT